MKLKESKGLTLIEIMLAMTILVKAIIPLMKMLGDALRGAQTFGDISIATQLAQDLMEEIKSKKWDENQPDDGSETTAYSAFPFVVDGGEPPYDDIDDYNGYSDMVDNKFMRSVDVFYVNVPDSGLITGSGVPTDFKQIRITVEWPEHTTDPATADPLLINTVRANYRRY